MPLEPCFEEQAELTWPETLCLTTYGALKMSEFDCCTVPWAQRSWTSVQYKSYRRDLEGQSHQQKTQKLKSQRLESVFKVS